MHNKIKIQPCIRLNLYNSNKITCIKGMIKIEGKHEKVKEKHKSRLWLKFLICIIVAFIIVMVGYLIVEKIKNNSNPEVTEKEEYYKIENIGNIKFENVSITIKDKMSYINIDLVNGEHQKISGQEINVKVIKEGKKVEYLYKIPDIEAGQTYNINLMTTGDLTNAEEIKVEGIEL